MTGVDEDELNGLMNKRQFEDLANTHGTHCISIYLPTYRAGEDVDSGKSRIMLKNLLKEARQKLDRLKIGDNEIDRNLEPAKALLDDKHFWRNQSDGLALYIKDGKMEHYTLPVHFKEQVYVADHFFMMPVIPLFNDDGTFFLLALSMRSVKFYECSRHMIAELIIDDLVPGELEQAVGYDYEDKNLQFRSGQDGKEGAMFHGHGSGKEDRSSEIASFFRSVDDGLMKILHEEDAPLVLACVDEYHPIYKKVSAYDHIHDEFVPGNPDRSDPILLHEKAWDVVQDHFKQKRKEQAEILRQLSATGRTSYDIREIIPAAVDGRVETLFLLEDTDEFGLYDENTRSLIIPEEPEEYQASLFNMAVVHTLLKGGNAFIEKEGGMPLKNTRINALLRY
jgi:hypothetical protein